MTVYSATDSIREAICKKCGKKYIETQYEYIGGPKYWSGHCDCTPISMDSVIKELQNQIKNLNINIPTNNWNYKVINLINNKLKQLIDKKFMDYRKYGVCNEFLKDGTRNKYIYIEKYPSKKNIANYVGKNINQFYKENRNITAQELFIKEILNISKEDFAHYLSYVCAIRKQNR